MDMIEAENARPLRPETEAERQARIAWEAAGIAEALADVAAGRVVDEAEVDAWIDSIGTDHELPVPYAGSRSGRV
jgi:predicted transcriptional regulator